MSKRTQCVGPQITSQTRTHLLCSPMINDDWKRQIKRSAQRQKNGRSSEQLLNRAQQLITALVPGIAAQLFCYSAPCSSNRVATGRFEVSRDEGNVLIYKKLSSGTLASGTLRFCASIYGEKPPYGTKNKKTCTTELCLKAWVTAALSLNIVYTSEPQDVANKKCSSRTCTPNAQVSNV